jgi:nucleoside-diphosphate-sugar epimerase
MKIVVAGGAGFIGSHLCQRLLNENHTVICLDNLLTGSESNINSLLNHKNFIFMKTDVSQPLPDLPKVDAVFHLASPASPNEESKISYHKLALETIKVNIDGSFNLINLALKNQARYLFASTSEIYGDPKEIPQKESYFGNVNPIGKRAVYDESKRMGETITSFYWREKNLNGRIARIFNTYGPRMRVDDKRMIVNFVFNALKNQPIMIYGDGQQTRSLCFVDDLTDGLIRLMFYPNTEKQVVNLGSDEEHSVIEYAELVKKLTNSKSEIIITHKTIEDDPKRRRPDVTKAKQLLNWSPTTTLEKGLKLTIEYYKKIIYQ